jgi:hypothetical protein
MPLTYLSWRLTSRVLVEVSPFVVPSQLCLLSAYLVADVRESGLSVVHNRKSNRLVSNNLRGKVDGKQIAPRLLLLRFQRRVHAPCLLNGGQPF